MSGFQHKWYGDRHRARTRGKVKSALIDTAADTVVLCQQPLPVGWPRKTGFLAGSTSFDQPVETEDGVTINVVARANYSIYVHAKTKTLARNGDAMAATIPDRIRKA